MMEVFREILPESYLLILTEEQGASGEEALRRALRLASRSGKRNVWVDCSHLHRLPVTVVALLQKYYQRFQQRNIHLVICHLADGMQQLFLKLPAGVRPPIVPTLLDAERYCSALRPRLPRHRPANLQRSAASR